MVPTPGQVWRTGTGQYAFTWQIPPGAPSGDYVANWTFTYGGAEYLGDGEHPGRRRDRAGRSRRGDTGYWTGGLIYGAAGIDIEFGQADGNGTSWLWQKITGWDGPPCRAPGSSPGPVTTGRGRRRSTTRPGTLTLTCTASAPVAGAPGRGAGAAAAGGPSVRPGVLRYDEPVSEGACVRRSGAVTEAYPTLADVTFTIGLVAPDMRKYATVRKTVTITPVPSGGGGGMVVPFTVPFTLDAAAPPGVGDRDEHRELRVARPSP